jgi:hypothetical protein
MRLCEEEGLSPARRTITLCRLLFRSGEKIEVAWNQKHTAYSTTRFVESVILG